MNALEFDKLKALNLSHISRTLYIFYLSPMAIKDEHTLDLGALATNLNSQSCFFKTIASIDIVKLCLTELEQLGFIKRRVPNSPWESALIDYPLKEQMTNTMPSLPFNMYKDWSPGMTFKDAALMVGLDNCEFSNQELTEFKSFWISKAEKRNQFSWERTFALKLVKKRRAQVSNQVAKSSPLLANNGNLVAQNSTLTAKTPSLCAQGVNPCAKTQEDGPSFEDFI